VEQSSSTYWFNITVDDVVECEESESLVLSVNDEQGVDQSVKVTTLFVRTRETDVGDIVWDGV
jgi:hypothetical protein